MEHVREIIAAKSIDETGLSFPEFRQIFEQRSGRPLIIEELGFLCWEQFISHGLSNLLEIHLLSTREWIIYPLGSGVPKLLEARDIDEKFEVSRESLKALFKVHPYGVSMETWLSQFPPMADFSVSRESLLCVALQSPEVCIVDSSQPELSILPADYKFFSESYYFPLHRLATPKKNIQWLVESFNEMVPVSRLQQRYLECFGPPDLSQLHLNSFFELCALMPDICTLYTSKHSSSPPMIESKTASDMKEKQKATRKNVRKVHQKFPEELLYNLRRLAGMVPHSQLSTQHLESQYKDKIGVPLNYKALGYRRVLDLLRALDGNQGFRFDGKRLLSNCQVQMLPVTRAEELPPGLVRVVDIQTCNTLRIISMSRENLATIWRLELQMERFYCERPQLSLAWSDCVAGHSVAALSQDGGLYRARILYHYPDTRPGLLKLLYVDHGWTALVTLSRVLKLVPKFTRIPEQAVKVTLPPPEGPCTCQERGESCSSLQQFRRRFAAVENLGYLSHQDNRVNISLKRPLLPQREIRDTSDGAGPSQSNMEQTLIKLVLREIVNQSRKQE